MFNILYDYNKQVVIISDVVLKYLIGFEDWMCSCFEWGLIIDVQVFDFEMCIVILCKKVQSEVLYILDEVFEYIVMVVLFNICELEGVLICVFVFVSLN